MAVLKPLHDVRCSGRQKQNTSTNRRYKQDVSSSFFALILSSYASERQAGLAKGAQRGHCPDPSVRRLDPSPDMYMKKFVKNLRATFLRIYKLELITQI